MARVGSGCSMGGTVTGLPLGARVSPVAVAASLATAPMSPATSSEAVSCSLPRTVSRPCSRSSVPVRLFTRWSSGRTVPDSTRNRLTCPT